MCGGQSDPRPINDKMYMNACTRKLIEFLSSHSYDHAVSLKVLARPAAKDFTNIVNFLFKCIDVNMKFGPKFEDEFITVLKNFRYPFQISKTALSAVGTPHTWPALLASVSWIVELLMYDEAVALAPADDNDGFGFGNDGMPATSMDKKFFDHLGSAYKSFLAGDDDKYHQLQEEQSQQYELNNRAIQSEIDDFERENERLREEINALRSRNSQMPALQSKKSDLIGDREKFKKLIQQLETNRSQLETKLQEKSREINAKDEEMATLQQELNTISSKIEKQEVSLADVQRMSDERRFLSQTCSAISVNKDTAQNSLWSSELERSKKIEELENAVSDVNKLGARLKLVPPGAQYANGRNLELRLGDSATLIKDCCGSLVTPDLKKTIKPTIQKIKLEVISHGRQARDEKFEQMDELEGKEELLREAKDSVQKMTLELSKAEEACAKEKKAMEGLLAQKRQKMETVEIEIHQYKIENASESISTDNRKVMESLRLNHMQNAKRRESEKRQIFSEIWAIVEACTAHKEEIQKAIEGSEAYILDKLDSMNNRC